MKRTYNRRLFIMAALCIWAVIIVFAAFSYRQEKELRTRNLIDRIALANGNIIRVYEDGEDIRPFMDYMSQYFSATALDSLSIQVYDTKTGELIHSIGKIYQVTPPAVATQQWNKLSDGSKVIRMIDTEVPDEYKHIFFYSSRISEDGDIEVRTTLPNSDVIESRLTVNPIFWLILLTVGLLGTIIAYFVSSHMAKNVQLLSEFAQRAAEDNDFIPMGDFPADEIGDISRQIITIYNQRTQANVRREREHAVALKAIEEQQKTKRILTDNISHELKTPVGIIRSYLDMLVNQPDMPPEDRQHFLEKAYENAERLVKMLNDLSSITRLSAPGTNIQLKTINFHNYIFGLVEDLKATDLIKNIDFKFNIPYDCYVEGNEELLNSVFMNLIRNSAAYAQCTQMGVELIERAPKFYTFSFFDNGVGVGAEHIPHLFDRFYRVDAGRSRKSGGTGLGLPIVKSSIMKMDGSIVVRNRIGGGLEFIFTLKRSASPAENNQQ